MDFYEFLKLVFAFLFALPLNPFLFPAILIPLIIRKNQREYENTQYYKITHLPFSEVKSDAGRYGEYLIYLKLKNFAGSEPKFLFNLYLPKANGETTEVDVVIITKKGVFTFESKNYHGWIFGDEKYSFWYQTFENGQKQQFFNPIRQNNLHTKQIKKILKDDTIPVWSIIVFSDNCVLKNIKIQSFDISVVNREYLYSAVSAYWRYAENVNLSDEQQNEIYNRLFLYSQATQEVKNRHISNLQNKY